MSSNSDTRCTNYDVCRSEDKALRGGLCRKCRGRADRTTEQTPHIITPAEQIERDRELVRARGDLAAVRLKYGEALKSLDRVEHELAAVTAMAQGVAPLEITPKESSGTSEATVVIVASDWHIEESVGAEVGGLNRYNLEIAESRAKNFFASSLRLVRLLKQDVTIHTIVLALLGDFITNDIHEEQVEKNSLTPTNAIITAQNWLIGGVEFLLEHTDCDIVLPCHSGNHARTTKSTRFGTENGHSLEFLMYLHMAAYFRHEPRVKFLIAEGMHSYLNIYGQTIRFHHGHAIKYAGGVGGIYIPVNKAIGQWDKGRRADLDVFGHYHQLIFAPKFVCNGSLIGYNSFALAIKADYERPQQALFMIDKKRGKTAMWPVLMKGDQ